MSCRLLEIRLWLPLDSFSDKPSRPTPSGMSFSVLSKLQGRGKSLLLLIGSLNQAQVSKLLRLYLHHAWCQRYFCWTRDLLRLVHAFIHSLLILSPLVLHANDFVFSLVFSTNWFLIELGTSFTLHVHAHPVWNHQLCDKKNLKELSYHSTQSEISGLCLMKLTSEMLQN